MKPKQSEKSPTRLPHQLRTSFIRKNLGVYKWKHPMTPFVPPNKAKQLVPKNKGKNPNIEQYFGFTEKGGLYITDEEILQAHSDSIR